MKFIGKNFILLFIIVFSFVLIFFVVPVKAGIIESFMSGVDDTAEIAGFSAEESDPIAIVGVVIKTLISVLGIIFLVLIIYAGFLWMTARGNEGQVSTAMDIIKSSIIGLIILLSAYAITYFVVNQITNATLGA